MLDIINQGSRNIYVDILSHERCHEPIGSSMWTSVSWHVGKIWYASHFLLLIQQWKYLSYNSIPDTQKYSVSICVELLYTDLTHLFCFGTFTVNFDRPAKKWWMSAYNAEQIIGKWNLCKCVNKLKVMCTARTFCLFTLN